MRRADTLEFIEENLMIQDKAGRLTPLKFNSLQLRLYQEMERQRSMGKPVRIIILKARQIGFSTATAGIFFARAANLENHRAMIVAHKADASTNIFNKAKLFYDCMPKEKRPMKRASNSKELIFENPSNKQAEREADPGLRSRIVIETAGNKDAGRSATNHDLHLSELAFWPFARETLTSLMQSVPNLPETTVVIESTANGASGAFYEEWQRAVKGESAFVPLFFPWWAHAEYQLPVTEEMQLSGEEQELQAIYGLSLEQIAWRRWCISANCGGDEEVFAQEYPANDEEAFLLSGRPVFDLRKLAAADKTAPKPEKGRVVEEHGRAVFVPGNGEYLHLYDKPKPGAEYVIGIDSAAGERDGDHSAMAVIEKESMQVAAFWHGHIDPDLLGQEAVLLARSYNGALLVPESNNHGIAVIGAIRRAHYGRIYRQRDPDSGRLGERWGFLTTARSKPLAVNALARYIREDSARLKDKGLIRECMDYTYDEKGHSNARAGAHDDRVMAMAIAVYSAEDVGRGPRFQEGDWGEIYGICDTTGY